MGLCLVGESLNLRGKGGYGWVSVVGLCYLRMSGRGCKKGVL